jgi:hypothetical protein
MDIDNPYGSMHAEVPRRIRLLDIRLVYPSSAKGMDSGMTEKETMEMVPDCAQPGDELCVLSGSDVPYSNATCNGGYFSMDGVSHVHGIMSGKSLTQCEGVTRKKRRSVWSSPL